MFRLALVLFTFIIISFLGCVKPPEFSNIPEIKFISFSKNTIQQGVINPNDSILVTFSFQDGDGDIGETNDSKVVNVFVNDSRDNDTVYLPFKAPFIPLKGGSNSISGEMTLRLNSICCIYPNGEWPCTPNEKYPTNTTFFSIYIKDRAGNKSNVIKTPPITIQCN